MANEPTIDQMDLIIARFMGMEGSDDFIRQNYRYYKSWDLLIPVIKKIKGMHMDILQQAYILDYMKAAGAMNNGWISLDIDKAHKGVYQFITWLNQQKQTNEISTKGI